MKHCACCGVSKPHHAFSKRVASRDGLQSKCKECSKTGSKEWYQQNNVHHKSATLQYHYNNREQHLQQMREYHRDNPNYVVLASRRYRKQHPGKVNARSAIYRAAKLNQTPAWSNLLEVERIYEMARLLSDKTSIQHEVDHVLPLQSPHVCGFHVENNLQIITKTENARKGNKLT